MKTTIKILALTTILIVGLVTISCQAFHKCSFGEWTTTVEATVSKAGQEIRICECGKNETREIPKIDISTVKELLQGSFKGGYIWLKITGDSFIAGPCVDGTEWDFITYSGTYLIEENVISFTENDGGIFDVMTFDISNGEITLTTSDDSILTKY